MRRKPSLKETDEGFEIIGNAGRRIILEGYKRESAVKKARWIRRGF
jgi:hypothetical protein